MDPLIWALLIFCLIDLSVHLHMTYRKPPHDKTGWTICNGDYLVGPYFEGDIRFVYKISKYEGSMQKPYIYRQVGNGPLEVVGRANQELDLSQFTRTSQVFTYEN